MNALQSSPETNPTDRLLQHLGAVLAGVFALLLIGYFATGAGGPMRLAVLMVPLAMMVSSLLQAARTQPYPSLNKTWNRCLLLLQVGLTAAAGGWLLWHFDALRMQRVGLWQPGDLLAGGVLLLLLLEQARRSYPALLIVIVALLAYALLGPRMPGFLQHGGIDWQRAIAVSSLEMSTGMFDRLAQLGLTLIAGFLLVLSLLKGLGSIEAILHLSERIAGRRPGLIAQSAVAGSFAVASVSGSGAANAATTGSATIPALIKAGFARHQAAAVETASSLGGQLMPPLMGIAAFLMAELMGVGFFEVIARGYAPALVYFAGVSLAVYLLSLRLLPATVASSESSAPLPGREILALMAWAASVGGLIALMGIARMPAMNAALWVACALALTWAVGGVLTSTTPSQSRIHQQAKQAGAILHDFAATTSALVVLLALLGVLTGLFTVTGVPTRLGGLMMEAAGLHLVAMVLLAFAFGYVVGMGLPVAPTYIIMAVVTVPFMVRAGIDPWVAHFFAFLVAVFGELSPPTSVTAAVTSRIAEASFMRTMFSALGLCLPLLTLAIGVFRYPSLVVEPGLAQWSALALVTLATLGMITAIQLRGRLALRIMLAISASVLLLNPGGYWTLIVAIVTFAAGAYLLLPFTTNNPNKSPG